MDGAALLAGLADRTLPPAAFNHTAHLAVAWQLLHQHPAEAETVFCSLVRAYVHGLGAEAKFHHTLSVTLLRLVRAGLRPSEDWASFRLHNATLFDDARGLVARHYSAGRLEAGRSQFAEPDRLPLP